MAGKILPLIPKHDIYVELFCGGASLFFRKEPSKTEVLNDTNSHIINFFRVLQDKVLYGDLIDKLNFTMYSQDEYRLSSAKIADDTASSVNKAWALFININQSFAAKINGGFAFSKDTRQIKQFNNKKDNLEQVVNRLKHVYLFNDDYSKLIKRFDSPDTVFYADPPYPNTSQGHYKGFARADFEKVVDNLSCVKGNVVISCYNNSYMPDNWQKHSFKSVVSADVNSNKKESIEVVYIK